MPNTVGILGTGAWGTVFSQVVIDAGFAVKLWGRNRETVAEINRGSNQKYVPGIALDPATKATENLEDFCRGIDALVIAVPSHVVRSVLQEVKPYLTPGTPVISLVKGVEEATDLFMTQVIEEALGAASETVVALSGPNLSGEIARKEPTGAVLACTRAATANAMADLCHTEYFRPYVGSDVIGCEVAGATKNVIAVAIGAADGLGLGTNSKAMLLTRGMAEITRLGVALGADPETFMGMAGMGDLVATCSSKLSRNYSFGYNVGKGMSIEGALRVSKGVVEGVRSCRQILKIGQSRGVDQPICRAVVGSVYKGADLRQIARAMMVRGRKFDSFEVRFTPGTGRKQP